VFLLLVTLVAPAAAQGTSPAAPGDASIPANIASLGALDYPVRTRAARLLRRAPEAEVVPALMAAVRNARADEYVRYRAFILLTSFNPSGMAALVRDMLSDRNDRVRETAYKWLEQHPDPQLTPTLLSTLQTEQAEFVRPALEGALAALGSDPMVQRALVAEVSRGLGVFRSAVIDALGRHRASYAVDAIAPIAREDGPLQVDAILALGRIGNDAARAALAQAGSPRGEAALTLEAAQCLLASEVCGAQIEALKIAATSDGVSGASVQAAIAGLGDIVEAGHDEAAAVLLALAATPSLHDPVAITLGATALRQPDRVLTWLGRLADPARGQALGLLKDGFDSLEADFGEEQFFAATRAAYWKAPDGSPARTLAANIIERLEF
jgi:HEAT repeat protein